MKKIVIDSGGTSLKYMILNEKYEIITEDNMKSPTLTTDFEIVVENIKKIIGNYDDIDAGVFAMAGYEAISKEQNKIVNSLFSNFSNYLLLTDGQLPLHYVNDDNVVCVSLGTGTVINVRNKDSVEQFLGLGYAIGDTGSGYEIGKKIIYHALAYKNEDLIESLKEVMGIDHSTRLIQYIWSDNIHLNEKIASATKSILSTNKKLKKLALEKYNESISEIVDYLKNIIKPNQTVILNGSIATKISNTKKVIESTFPHNKVVLIDKNPLKVGQKILRDRKW